MTVIFSLQPFLLGKVKIPFRQWLLAGASSRVVAPLTSSVPGPRGGREEGREGEGDSEKEAVGKLTVRNVMLQNILLINRKRF